MYQEYSPCNALSPYIDKYWEYKEESQYGSEISIPPYGCTDFVFTLEEAVNYLNSNLEMHPYRSYFVGPMNTHTELVASTDRVHMVGIRFLPCGLYSFMGLALNDLTNHKCAANDLTNIFDRAFIERLCDKHNAGRLVEIIDEFLIKRMGKYAPKIDKKILFAVDEINRNKGTLSIRSLMSDISLCQRHFERKFKMYTGYSPKEYSRIVKFWNAINLLRHTSYDNLLSTAVLAGYYDVPHFIREVKRLSGNPPSSFFLLPSQIDTRIYFES